MLQPTETLSSGIRPVTQQSDLSTGQLVLNTISRFLHDQRTNPEAILTLVALIGLIVGRVAESGNPLVDQWRLPGLLPGRRLLRLAGRAGVTARMDYRC